MAEKYVLGIGGSPRVGGNSDLLLDACLSGAFDAGAKVEKIVLNHLAIAPCQECGGCNADGRCVVQDDMQIIYPKLRQANHLVIASPIYFSSVTAQLKAMIDRTQSCWMESNVLDLPVHDSNSPRTGLFIAVGAREDEKNFTGAEQIIRSFFVTQEIKYLDGFFFSKIEARGDILKTAKALESVRVAGRELIS